MGTTGYVKPLRKKLDIDETWRGILWFTVMEFLHPGDVDAGTLGLPHCAFVRDSDDYVWYCILSALSHNEFVVSGRAMHEGRGLRLWVTSRMEDGEHVDPLGPSKYASRTVILALDGILRVLEVSVGNLSAWRYYISLQQLDKEVGVEVLVYPRGNSFMAKVCKRLYERLPDDSVYTVNPALAFGEYLNIDWEEP
jgi:hypothetical protein